MKNLIDRDELLSFLDSRAGFYDFIEDLAKEYSDYNMTSLLEFAEKILDGFSNVVETAEIVSIHYGEWLPVDEKNDAFDCSECDVMVSKRHNYCPNCGAKMGIKGYYHGKIIYQS